MKTADERQKSIEARARRYAQDKLDLAREPKYGADGKLIWACSNCFYTGCEGYINGCTQHICYQYKFNWLAFTQDGPKEEGVLGPFKFKGFMGYSFIKE